MVMPAERAGRLDVAPSPRKGAAGLRNCLEAAFSA
jgi:hypothetical protein